jgi:hypothetical protein
MRVAHGDVANVMIMARLELYVPAKVVKLPLLTRGSEWQ